ncbi:MAG: ATP-binding protein [Limnohabitans sp.]
MLRQARASLQAALQRRAPEPRHGLLLYCLLFAGAISLVFFFLAPPIYERQINLLASLVYWLLALFVRAGRAYTLLCNLAMLTTVCLMTAIVTQTGGINSPAMVWLTVMAIPALLLLGQAWAWLWVGLILLVITIEWLAVSQGWIGGAMEISPRTIVWAAMDKIFMAAGLIVVVNHYERIHQKRLQAVAQSNAELEAAQQALAQTQAHKDDFMASVGHELRTPMNAILGLNSVLQSELADQPQSLKLAGHIQESADQLLRLVNDILDFSQLEAGRLQLVQKPVQLQRLLDAWMPGFLHAAQHKGLHLDWQIGPQLPEWIMADAVRLRQILTNLLDNAIKFTEQGEVCLRMQRVGEHIRFEVRDSGPGIAPHRQKDIFNRFEHADLQTQHRYGGTGLGLAICEQLVLLHHGRIGVESEPGHGACFWFEWALRPAWPDMPQSLAVPDPVPAGVPGRRLHFLLVDDSPVNLVVARQLLEQGWPQARISTADSGEQALQMLQAQEGGPVDLVFMDMLMPGLDGAQTTRRLRLHSRAEIASTPVVALTASNSPQDLERCTGAGMNDILVKPIDRLALAEVVQRWTTPQEAL